MTKSPTSPKGPADAEGARRATGGLLQPARTFESGTPEPEPEPRSTWAPAAVLLSVLMLTMLALLWPRRAPAAPPLTLTPASATPRPTLTRTPTRTAVPTPTATITPSAAQLLDAWHTASASGDDDALIRAGQAALQAPLTGAQRADVLYAVGIAQWRAGLAADAAQTFQALYVLPAGASDPAVLFLLARTEGESGAYREAVGHFEDYLAQHTIGSAYAYAGLGDAYAGLGDSVQAEAAYAQADEAGLPYDERVRQPERLAQALAASGDVDGAVAAYEDLLAGTSDEAELGHGYAEIARLLLAAGQTKAAYLWLNRLITEAPGAPEAPAALAQLLASGHAISPRLQGLIAYRAQDYPRAITLLQQSLLLGGPSTNFYYIGMAHAFMNQPAEALKALEQTLNDPDSSDLWDLARRARARQLAALHRVPEALAEFDALAETDSDAAWDAAALALEYGRYADARARYAALAELQWWDVQYVDAVFHVGLCDYLAGEATSARETWEDLLARYPNAEPRPDIMIMLGKQALVAGDRVQAEAYLGQVSADYPNTYYSFRARALLTSDGKEVPFARAVVDFDVTPAEDAAERATLEAWLRVWLDLPAEAVVDGLGPELQTDVQRMEGARLWRMGLWEAARDEFEVVRVTYISDPLAQYQLALYFRDIGLYRSSILAARRVVDLSPANGTLDAPRYLQRLVYPTYYRGLIVPAAERNGLDPVVLFGLARQESLFESFVESYATAAGLLQIMPGTGAYIAAQVDMPQYETGDLYRPSVNVYFGAWYLAEQAQRFDGDVYAALAAYNAGPARAAYWRAAAGGHDPDALLGLVDIEQTEDYIELIYLNHVLYRTVYGVAGK